MEITTIACPVGLEHPSVNPETAPIWFDKNSNEYRIASGMLEESVEPTEHTTAKPDVITVIKGVDGLAALVVMGLKGKESD